MLVTRTVMLLFDGGDVVGIKNGKLNVVGQKNN